MSHFPTTDRARPYQAAAPSAHPATWLLLAALALLLIACRPTAVPTATVTPTPLPPPVVTATPSPAATPTNAAAAPTETAAPTATSTGTVVPSATPTQAATDTPTATATAAAQQPTRISFEPGTVSAQIDGEIEADGTDLYVLRALQGQVMSVGIAAPNQDVLLTIVGADGVPLKRYVDGSPTWTGELPVTQDYVIEARSFGPRTPYTLYVLIEPLQPRPTPPERVQFAAGATSAARSGRVPAGDARQYLLNATAGQLLQVNVTSYQAPLDLVVGAPDGQVFIGQASSGERYAAALAILLPASGDYRVALAAAEATTDYDVEFIIESPSVPERVRFATGATAATREGVLPQGGGSRAYVLAAMAGQTLDVRAFGGNAPVTFTVQGAGGALWAGRPFGMDSYAQMATLTLPQSGDYTVVLATGPGAAATGYSLTLTVADSSAQPPGSPPERVTFAPGTSALVLQGSMPEGGGVKRYVLGAAAGQRMEVGVTSDNAPVRFDVSAPDGTVWEAGQLGSEVYIWALAVALPQAGDYVVALTSAPGAAATLYTFNVSIR